jgi:hypothetical protein
LQWCGGKIAALLQAFGLSVGLCGLANVLQCAVGFSKCGFLLSIKPKTIVRSGFTLAANGCGYETCRSAWLRLYPTTQTTMRDEPLLTHCDRHVL